MMEKMGRLFIENDIPVWMWGGIPLIRLTDTKFITFNPVEKGVRSLEKAKETAKNFAEKYHCKARVPYEDEWKRMILFLKANFGAKEFIEMNDLGNNEVLLLDSLTEGTTHVLSAGCFHALDEIFRGFISGDDADGEPQPQKLLFLTIKFDPDQIE